MMTETIHQNQPDVTIPIVNAYELVMGNFSRKAENKINIDLHD